MFTSRTSIHGRNLAISATGGFISARDSTGGGSTAFDMAAQMWGKAMIETVSSAGATISNTGITIVSTDSTGGASFVMSAPVAGVYKEVHFQTGATLHTLNTSATTIYFNSTLAEAAAGGSTTLSITGTASGTAGVLTLRGLTATQWSIVSHTVAATT